MRSSYDPRATPSGLAGEIRRLDAQVELSWEAELQALRTAGIEDGMSIVELGCGSGAFLERLARALPTSSFTGLEPDPDLAAAARLATTEFGTRVVLVEAGIDDSPLALAGRADVVIARFVFQHLPDPVGTARKVSALLASGGLLVVIEVDGMLWGLASPSYPALSSIHSRAWAAQSERGGDRFIGHKLFGYLADAGYRDVRTQLAATHSDEVGLAPFLPVIDPAELQPLVAEGVLSLDEYGRLVAGYTLFRNDPEAFVMTVNFVVSGRWSP